MQTQTNPTLSKKGLTRKNFGRNAIRNGVAGGSSRSEAKIAACRITIEKAKADRRLKHIREGRIYRIGEFSGSMRACRNYCKSTKSDYSLISQVTE